MEVLADQRTGPLAKTVASLLLKKDLDIEKVVQQTLLPHYSQAATDILGLETVTVETLLQLPRVSDEDLYTRGDYLKLIDLDGWQQYWGSATGSQSSTMFASMAQSPTYSPQSSPPPPNTWQRDQYYQTSPPHRHQNGEWAQPGGHPYPQTYYPPPSDPSQSPARKSPYEISAELLGVRSSVNAEMSDVRSLIGGQLPDLRSPVPVRGGL